MHSDDVRMINFLQSQDLALYGFPLHAIIQLNFLINFDGALLHRLLMVACVHCCVRTLPDWLANLIIIKLSKAYVSDLVEGVLVRVGRAVQEGRMLRCFQPILFGSAHEITCRIQHFLFVRVVLHSNYV